MKRKFNYPARSGPRRSNLKPVSVGGKLESVTGAGCGAPQIAGESNEASGNIIQILEIPDIGPSLNEYDRMYFRKRSNLARAWKGLVGVHVREQGLVPVKTYPVLVEVTCFFGKGRTRFDWDNLGPTPKLIQDGLVHAKILKNDSPKYISLGSMQPLKTEGDSYTIFKIIERQAA